MIAAQDALKDADSSIAHLKLLRASLDYAIALMEDERRRKDTEANEVAEQGVEVIHRVMMSAQAKRTTEGGAAPAPTIVSVPKRGDRVRFDFPSHPGRGIVDKTINGATAIVVYYSPRKSRVKIPGENVMRMIRSKFLTVIEPAPAVVKG